MYILKTSYNLLLKNPGLGRFILRKTPPDFFTFIAKLKLKKTINKILKIPAYKKFLRAHNIVYKKITSLDQFCKLPITDKRNYLQKYNRKELLSDADLTNYCTIEKSSGFSGKPHYWMHTANDETNFMYYYRFAMQYGFNIQNKTSLIINTWALGSWVTGMGVARASSLMAYKKNKFTIINTGTNLREANEMIREFHKYYQQVIILGYPPFVKKLIEKIAKTMKDIKKINIKLLIGGESIPEGWRDYVGNLLYRNKKNAYVNIFSAYGAAEVGLGVFFETTITILLKKLLTSNHELFKQYFKHTESTPIFFQYNPLNFWIEEINGELVYTKYGSIPLMRYNIHDRGGILSYTEMLKILSHKYNIKKLVKKLQPLHLPIVYLFGRTKDSFQIGGANIYIDQIKNILTTPEFAKFFTGKFKTNIEFDKKLNSIFAIKCEVYNIEKTKKHMDKIQNLFINKLCEVNSEYENSYKDFPDQCNPHFELVKQNGNDTLFDEQAIKYKYT